METANWVVLVQSEAVFGGLKEAGMIPAVSTNLESPLWSPYNASRIRTLLFWVHIWALILEFPRLESGTCWHFSMGTVGG